ncbi:MAG: histidine phosphatase family protein [Pseudomonadota bacterium]
MTPKTISHRELEEMKDGRTRLYLVRHGELTTSQEWRYVGHMDVDLNSAGVEQLQRLGARLKDETIDVVLSSDLKRTVRSAEIISATIGRSPIPEPDFREISLGCWEGMTMNEIVEKFPEEFEKRSLNIAEYRIEGGESFADVHSRAIPRLMSYLAEYKGKNILLVAHGGVNRVILCHVLGVSLKNLTRIDQSYGCLNIIDYFNGEPVVRLVNESFFAVSPKNGG